MCVSFFSPNFSTISKWTKGFYTHLPKLGIFVARFLVIWILADLLNESSKVSNSTQSAKQHQLSTIKPKKQIVFWYIFTFGFHTESFLPHIRLFNIRQQSSRFWLLLVLGLHPRIWEETDADMSVDSDTVIYGYNVDGGGDETTVVSGQIINNMFSI